MLKKTIEYVDFNDEPQKEDFYFHLTKAEIVELEMSKEGGMGEWLKRIVAAEDGGTIMTEMRKIILGAYGRKSIDGKRFIKNDELREEFASSEAYSVLFMELVTQPDAAATFAAGLVPKDVAEEATKIAGADLTVVPSNAVEITNYTKDQLLAMDSTELGPVLEDIKEGRALVTDTHS